MPPVPRHWPFIGNSLYSVIFPSRARPGRGHIGSRMNTYPRLEADLAARVAVLFRDCPELSGFTVQEEMAVPASLV